MTSSDQEDDVVNDDVGNLSTSSDQFRSRGKFGAANVKGVLGPRKIERAVSLQMPEVLLRSTSPQANTQSTQSPQEVEGEEIDKFLSVAVNETLVKKALRGAMKDCKFCVTIASPRGEDYPLIAVSEEFEAMTGYSRNEIIGVNCRFLNQGVDVNPEDLVNLRIASKTGCPFTAVLPNRKKSGELFLNLLDVRGLTVARDSRTGEDFWFFIGIQADVSDLGEDQAPEDHVENLKELADFVRTNILQELAAYTISSHEKLEDFDGGGSSASLDSDWILLESPEWRPGAPLGRRKCEEDLRQATGQGQLHASAEPGQRATASAENEQSSRSASVHSPAKGEGDVEKSLTTAPCGPVSTSRALAPLTLGLLGAGAMVGAALLLFRRTHCQAKR